MTWSDDAPFRLGGNTGGLGLSAPLRACLVTNAGYHASERLRSDATLHE